MARQDEPDDRTGTRPYEVSDFSVRPVMQFTVVLTLGLALVIALMVVLFNTLERIESRAEEAAHPMTVETVPPAPRLQTSTAVDLIAHREREEEILERYGWVDRENGKVRIPIERAMDLVLERGLPVRK
jgi:hypothetical protein